MPDGGGENAVSLGVKGLLILQFTDNYLATSGDDSPELYILEIRSAQGTAVDEPVSVSISVDGDT